MNNAILLSVITLTRNRAHLLEKCLASLKGQLLVTDEIIIIDNNSTDNTQILLKKYKRILPVRVYKSGLSGYPNLYNFAISKCVNPLIVFLDDDCMATPGFIARIRNKYSIKQNYVLQGKTLSLPRNNIFSEISERHLANWINANVVAGNKLQVIDNRNVVIPKVIIDRVGNFSPGMKTGSEDVEFGLRLFSSGIPIIYDPSHLVYHHERTNLKDFLFQHYRIAKSHAVLDRKVLSKQRLFVFNRRTWHCNFHSALELLIRYWRVRRYKDISYLPSVYLLLVITRIIGYLSGKHEQN
ncbi:glycosyltransferase family 2 protein [Candidatus Gottesmanbacteria bacterium]|nr:glycosyltransferase family 2 protein [Candidatus Gottesmanbacteria bacterium]